MDILAVYVTGLADEGGHRVYYQNASASKFDFAGAYAGAQLQFPFTKDSVILMPYLTAQAGVKFSNWDDLKVDFAIRTELGGRINFFLGKSNVTMFLDLHAQMLTGNFSESAYMIDYIFATGMSF